MRVLFVNPVAELGGSERSLLDLVASLHRAAPDVEKKVVLFADGELGRRIRELGVDVATLPLPDALSSLGEFSRAGAGIATLGRFARGGVAALPFVRSLRRLVLDFRPSVVHTNGMKAHVLGALAAPDFPRVVHLRDFVGERPVTRRLLRLLGRRALVVANSKSVAEDALRADASLRVRVVYNGVDLESFQPHPRELEHLAALASLPVPPAEAVIVGLVATYAWWKGHRTFLDAAARVRAELGARPLRFYVVGGRVYRTQGSQTSESELRRAIEELGLAGDVGLVPFENDVARVYRGLDVVVHASERPEPFGRTIVEGMASGRAVVAARAGGAAELFREGENGVGFRPGDAADLARVLSELVRDGDLRRRLGASGRAHAESSFGRERLAPELIAAYEALCTASVRA